MINRPKSTPQPGSTRSFAGRISHQLVRENPIFDSISSKLVRTFGGLTHRGHRLSGTVGSEPFFIVGSGRSGNTLLRRILNNSPGVHIPPETYVLGRVIKLYERNSHQPWPILTQLVLSTFEYRSGFETFGITLRPLYNEIAQWPRPKRNLAAILDAIYRFHASETGVPATRWGDKTPLNAYNVERIHRVFPGAKYIHIVRDGVDVVHSYISSGLLDTVAEASTRWHTAVESVASFAARNPRSCHEVRYEALVTKPEETVEALCSFLAISYEPAMLRGGTEGLGDAETHQHHDRVSEAISESRVGEGRRSLSSDDLQSLDSRFLTTLESLGYEVPGGPT